MVLMVLHLQISCNSTGTLTAHIQWEQPQNYKETRLEV